MRKLFALLILSLASSLALAANASYGEHGMALFGGPDGLYASHLPMFHAPHDYQVILRIRLADKVQDAALRKRLNDRPVLWTLAPEKFELDRLAPGAVSPLASFKADLVQGHFEQGGKTRYAGVAVVVEQVLLYRQLSPDAMQQATAHYLQLGSGGHRYLVKQIDSRPDFDHIVPVRAAKGMPTDPLDVPKAGLVQTPSSVLAHALPGARIAGSVYFSTEDLQ
ncbi:MAG: hypothetical protein ACJ8GW_11005 [Massilia sp.]